MTQSYLDCQYDANVNTQNISEHVNSFKTQIEQTILIKKKEEEKTNTEYIIIRNLIYRISFFFPFTIRATYNHFKFNIQEKTAAK